MANVVGIRPNVVTEPDGPDAECVEFLESLLARARSGAIIGCAVVTVGPQGSIGTGWKGNVTCRDMAAAVGLLHHRYYASWLVTDDEVEPRT